MYALDEAVEFMQEAHKGQTRWDNKTPYSTHPQQVVKILRDMGVRNQDVLCAGYLHDVLEDTDYGLDKIQEKFGKDVGRLVVELTNPSEKMSDEEYWKHIEKMSTKAKVIKFADIIANTKDWSHQKHFYTKRAQGMVLIVKGLISEFELE